MRIKGNFTFTIKNTVCEKAVNKVIKYNDSKKNKIKHI